MNIGNWVCTYDTFTEAFDGSDITAGRAYEVRATDENCRFILFIDDNGDLRRRYAKYYQVIPAPSAMQPGADEYNEIIAGDEAWASIRTSSDN